MKNIKETDFMAEIDAVKNSAPSSVSIVLLSLILLLVISFFLWASFSKLDILVRGSGSVVPGQENQIVQSLEGGILVEKLISEGDRVSKNQILMRVSDVNFSSEEKGTEARLASLNLKKARLLAEANEKEFSIDVDIKDQYPQMAENERALYDSRKKEFDKSLSILDNKIISLKAKKSELNARISKVRNNLSLLKKEYKITKEMLEKKAVSKLEKIRLEREVSDVDGTIKTLKEQLKGLVADEDVAIGEKQYQIQTFKTRALGEITEVETELAALNESLKSIGDRVDRTEIRSPVNGIVNAIAIKTIGGIVEPAMKLIEIVPIDDDLKIIAKISPNDIAFLKKGMNVRVKISSYDSQRYGSLDGKLVRIAANSTSDKDGNVFFEVEVKTDVNYLGTEANPLPITYGMLADIEIITGKRTVMEYLSKPLLRLKDKAMTEI